MTWRSSATNVATVNTNGVAGLAKAMGAGSASISATLSGVSGSATLTITNAKLVSIAVTPANASINVKTQQQFTAMVASRMALLKTLKRNKPQFN